MKFMKSQTSVLGLLGISLLSVTSKLTTDRPSNMFKLDEDSMIIKTPEHLEDLPVMGSVQNDEHKENMFKMETLKPLKDKQFFKPEDFDLETEKVKIEPETKEVEDMDKEEVSSYIDAINGIKGMFKEITKEIPKEQVAVVKDEGTFENDYQPKKSDDSKISNTLRPKDDNMDAYWKYRIIDISDNRRPIYGVLTEPLRGDMRSKNETGEVFEIAEDVSYIPKAHVSFLEQSGIVVVPISFLDSDEEIISMLNEVNGVYIAGDSHKAVANRKYQKAFSTILKYVSDKNTDTAEQKSDYFPMFVMGKGLQTFVSQVGLSNSALQEMGSSSNANCKLNLLHSNHNDTFLLHQLQFDDSANHAFDLGSFYNRQQVGVRLQDLKNDERLVKWITPLASFNGSGQDEPNHKSNQTKPYDPKSEFVAIAEGTHLPVYIFTYNIEMTQFVFTDLIKNLNQTEHIDKSIPARHHAQFVSNQIADEARLNNHKFELSDKDYMKLIRHHELASVEYSEDQVLKDSESAIEKGLEKHDIYIINQAAETEQDFGTAESTDKMLLHLMQ